MEKDHVLNGFEGIRCSRYIKPANAYKQAIKRTNAILKEIISFLSSVVKL